MIYRKTRKRKISPKGCPTNLVVPAPSCSPSPPAVPVPVPVSSARCRCLSHRPTGCDPRHHRDGSPGAESNSQRSPVSSTWSNAGPRWPNGFWTGANIRRILFIDLHEWVGGLLSNLDSGNGQSK